MDLNIQITNLIKEPSTKKENILQKITQYLDSLNGRIENYSVDILFKRTSSEYETQTAGRLSEPTDSVICFSQLASCTVIIYIYWKLEGLRKYSIMNIEADNESSFKIN